MKTLSSTVIFGLLIILGVGLNLSTIESWMTSFKTSTVTAKVAPVAEMGRYMDELPAVNGYRIAALNQTTDYVCLRITDENTTQTYYYDTTSRIAGPANCKKG